jgi:hypothetical protein
MFSLDKLMQRWGRIGLALIAVIFTMPLHGDDGAVSVGAGGIVLRREVRISMEKERLVIGMRKVAVEFDFLNESEADVTTEVGFPIPTYQWPYLGSERIPNFSDFRVWIDGQELKYKTEIRARRNGQDYTVLLQQMGINIETFGDFDEYEGATRKKDQITPLSSEQKRQLVELGLIEQYKEGAYSPHWSVSKMYYWEQTFPAHKLIHIRHEYTPVAGAAQIPVEYFNQGVRSRKERRAESDPTSDNYANSISEMIRGACIDPALQKKLSSHSQSGLVFVDYVNYILTSANSWKTPIRDFELVIDRSNPWASDPVQVSFCWDGPVQMLDSVHFSAKKSNLVPTKEIAIFFFRH